MSEQVAGVISQIIGPVVDITFDQDARLPNIYDALVVTNEDGKKIVLEAQQDIGENTIRAVAMDSTDGLRRGMKAVATGRTITMPVGPNITGRLFNVIGQAIDGLAPLPAGDFYSIHRDPPKFE
jgi:F-type H+-transporting ATPase subunit beta